MTNGIYKCTCEYCVYGRGRLCPHTAAVQEYLKRKTRIAIQRAQSDQNKRAKPTCRDCKVTNYRLRELMRNKRSTRPRYLCLDCNVKFVFAPGSKGKHYGEEVMEEALDNVIWGDSARISSIRVKKDVPTPDGKHPCGRTVSNWVKESGILYKAFMDNVVSPKVKDSISADEKYSTDSGMETWNYTAMDIESRYIINHES